MIINRRPKIFKKGPIADGMDPERYLPLGQLSQKGSDCVVDERDVQKTSLDPAHWAVFIAAVLPILVVIFVAWLAGAFPH